MEFACREANDLSRVLALPRTLFFRIPLSPGSSPHLRFKSRAFPNGYILVIHPKRRIKSRKSKKPQGAIPPIHEASLRHKVKPAWKTE